MTSVINAIGGRKFIFGITLLIILGVMFCVSVNFEVIDKFFNYALVIFGLYVGGNVVQKFSENNKQ